ncbi:MAG: NAD(P)/FAD-dependent oxidoreductase [Xanthomonadales bacterium]|nr:NAD(P)/FAD-dependent oxidoreductase [Xanthomonadales bacterium]
MAVARRLASAPIHITLIDRSNHHLFQPLLYQVAAASLAAPSIAAPLRQMLRKQANLSVRLDEVLDVDTQARRVQLTRETLDYVFLVLASGATHAYFGHAAWEHFAPGLKTLDDALTIRRRILLAFEYAERESDAQRRQAWLNFVVVGGGPTGVELAGTLAELAQHTLPGEYRHVDTRAAKVLLAEAGSRLLSAYDSSLSAKACAQLQQLGVEVRLNSEVTHIDADGVTLGSEPIAARTVLWAAGVAASHLGRRIGAPVDKVGRVLVAADLSLTEHPEVFVIGDLASVTQANGKPVPGVAPAAKQMGEYVAKVLRQHLRGQDYPDPFVYHDDGSLATIGRMAAVAQFGKLKLSGAMAWWVWLFAHIYFLIGFRNRLVVMLDWAWSYLTWQRHARIVIHSDHRRDDSATPPDQ